VAGAADQHERGLVRGGALFDLSNRGNVNKDVAARTTRKLYEFHKLILVEQGDDFLDLPNVVSRPRRHRRGQAPGDSN
jgi:hypothetical protein